MHLSRFVLVAFSLSLPFIAAGDCVGDEPAPKAKSLADRVAAIKKEHQECEKKFYDDLTTYRKDDKKIRELNDDYQKASSKRADELTALIKSQEKEPAAFEGILVLVGDLRHFLDDQLVAIVLKEHLAHPKMGQLCFSVRYRSEPWARKLLEAVTEKHPQKEVRGQALYALGIYHRYRAQPFDEKLSEQEEGKRWADAARCFTEVAKNYAAVTTPGGKSKLGEKAESELIRIKNLPNLKVGRVAPDIVGEDFDGKKFSLRDYRGKVVLLDFWAHW